MGTARLPAHPPTRLPARSSAPPPLPQPSFDGFSEFLHPFVGLCPPFHPGFLLGFHSHLPCFSDAASYGVPPFLPRFLPRSHPPRHPLNSRRKLPIFGTGQRCQFSLHSTPSFTPCGLGASWSLLEPLGACWSLWAVWGPFPRPLILFSAIFRRNNVQRIDLLA